MVSTGGFPQSAPDALARSPQQYNQDRLLDALGRQGIATRGELARITGLSRATVAAVIARAIAAGRVREVPPTGPIRPGRPAVALALTAPPGVVVGLDFGHGHLRCAVADLDGYVRAEEHQILQVDNSPDDALRAAAQQFRQLLAKLGRQPADVAGVVMGLPSPIHSATGRVVTNNILPGWVDRRPAQELHDLIHLPVVLDNDANLAALGELSSGDASGTRNLIYVKASTGIGTGLVFDGRLYRGATGAAGELGHIQIQPDGAICRCGNRGCLETLVSIPHILATLQPAHHEPLTLDRVIQLVATGDVGARRVVTDAGRVIGRALADLCNVLNPDAVIIGGELAAAGTALTAGIREAINHYTQPATAAAVTVRTTTLGDRGEVLGAIALAIQFSTKRAT